MHTKERLIYAGCALLLVAGISIGGFQLLKEDHSGRLKPSKLVYMERGEGGLSSVGSPILYKDTAILRKIESGWFQAIAANKISDVAANEISDGVDHTDSDGAGELDGTEVNTKVEVTSRPRRTEVGLTNLQKTNPAVVGVGNATASNITNKPTSSAPVNNNTGGGSSTSGGSSTGGGSTGGGSSTSGGNTGGGNTGSNTGGNTGGSTQPGTPTVNTVTIKNIKHNAVYDKNSQATITFDLEAGSTIVPTTINVNDKDIALRASTSGGYEFVYAVGSQAGEQTLTIKNLKVGNTAYTCSASVVLDVKRDSFSIGGVKLDKDTLYWTVTDKDGSLVSLTLSVSGDGGKVVDNESLDASMGGMKLDESKLEDGKTYKVEFSGVYKLDTQGKTTKTVSYSMDVIYQANQSGGADQGDSTDYSNLIKNVYIEGDKTYFDKDEEIPLCIDTTDFPNVKVNSITISDKIYQVSSAGNGVYKINVGAGQTSGDNTITISSINVEDGVNVPVTGKSITYSVLKEAPTGSVTVTDNKNGSYDLTVSVTDNDSAIVGGITVVIAEENGSTVRTEIINTSATVTVSVPKNTTYTYKVHTKYDLGDGKQTELELKTGFLVGLEEQLALDFKDIKAVTLYNNGQVVEGFTSTPADVSGYYMEIEPVHAPKLYADVASFETSEDNSKVFAVADLDGFVMYPGGVKAEGFKYVFDYKAPTTTVKLDSAQELFDAIKANRNITYELTKDLDASGLVLDNGYGYYGTFMGTINGNGHTIYNMPCPMFWGMTGGKINDLTICSANVNGKNSFIVEIANGNSSFKNVKVIDSTLTTTGNKVGSIIGQLTQSTVTDCAVINSSITGNNTIGGIVGELQQNSTIDKSVVIGTTIGGTLAGNANGTRAGGIVGWLNGAATIQNCLADVELVVPDKKGSGGIFGAPNTADAGTVTNCVVKVIGADRFSICGANEALGKVTNVYQLANNPVIQTGNTLSTITHYDSAYLVNTLGVTRDYADRAEKLANPLGGVLALGIMDGYDSAKETAYANIMKLAPWLDSSTVISAGNALAGDLATKPIKGIYPLDSNNKFVHTVDATNAGTISSIRILYDDKTFETLSVNADEVVNNLVDTYTITSAGIPYHFNKYIFTDSLGLANKVKTLASGYTYDANISTVYADSLVRQYKYIYENDIATNLESYAKRLVAGEFASASKNTVLKSTLETKIATELPKLLYTYTYFRKNFGFEMGGVDIADLVYFDSEVLNPGLTLDSMVKAVSSYNRGMTNAYNVFEVVVGGATGITTYDQLELFLRMGGVTDYDAWLRGYLDCHIVSQPVLGYTPTLVEYTAWDNLTNPNWTGGNCNLLALLTIPEEFQSQLAVVSTVGTVLFTDVNVYFANPTEANLATFRANADRMGELYARYFGTSLNYIPKGEESLFNDLTYQYDTVQAYPSGSKYAGVALTANESALVMWLGEPVGKSRTVGASAVSTGNHIFYGNNKALVNLGLFSHENAHSQDGSYFLAGNGRRAGGTYDVEFYTEGFFTEPGSEGIDDISANRVSKWGINDEVTAAFDYERLNSPEELEDYYKDLFNTWYAFDAIAANAFLNGGADVQYQAGKYGYYMDDPNDPFAQELPDIVAARKIPYIGYWKNQATLTTYDDLWTNRVVYKALGGIGSGYERPKFFEMNWWMPSNDIGSVDSNTFKLMGYDMLGYAGWEDGMIGWASGKYPSDEAAIKGITGYNGMEAYKKARFNEAFTKIGSIPYFDDKKLEAVLTNIFANQNPRSATPATQIKAIVINTIKRVTDDFTDGTMYEMTKNNYYKVSSAQQLIEVINNNSMKKGVYIELEKDIDFSGITAANSYYAEHFIGIINGNGNTIKNLSHPLLKSAKFSIFYGITFEGTASAYLTSTTSRYSLAYDCYYENGKALFDANSNTAQYVFTVLNNQPKTMMRLAPLRLQALPEASVSDNSVSVNSVSVNSVSVNSVSVNTASDNSVLVNSVSGNSIDSVTESNASVSDNSLD